MERNIEVNGKKFIVRELLAKEVDEADINWEDTKDARKKQLMLSTNLTSDEYDNLTMKERLKIQQTFNELNIEDFQQPIK
jgi:hypothetical protein